MFGFLKYTIKKLTHINNPKALLIKLWYLLNLIVVIIMISISKYNKIMRTKLRYVVHFIIVRLLIGLGLKNDKKRPKFGNPLWYMVAGKTKFIYRYLALVTRIPVKWNFDYLVMISWLSLIPFMLYRIVKGLCPVVYREYTQKSSWAVFSKQFIFYKAIYWYTVQLYINICNVGYSGSFLRKTTKVVKTASLKYKARNILLQILFIITTKNSKEFIYKKLQTGKSLFSYMAKTPSIILLKFSLVALLSAFLIFWGLYITLYINSLKQLGFWFICANLFLWLFSTFNFFIKRNRFGKFTGAVQRFWKRANNSFWVIELCLFTLGFYYFLNTSQEPLFMYDTAALNLQHFINPTSSYWSLVILGLVVYLGYALVVYIPHTAYKQQVVLIGLLISLVILLLSVETYQFYYLISSTADTKLNFDVEHSTWFLDWDSERLRIKYYYFNFCLILKYWHFVFMSLSWVFFVLKSFELKRVRYALLGFNIQNTLIVYFLSLAYQIYWLKWSCAKYLDNMFYYFGTNINTFDFSDFFQEFLLMLL